MQPTRRASAKGHRPGRRQRRAGRGRRGGALLDRRLRPRVVHGGRRPRSAVARPMEEVVSSGSVSETTSSPSSRRRPKSTTEHSSRSRCQTRTVSAAPSRTSARTRPSPGRIEAPLRWAYVDVLDDLDEVPAAHRGNGRDDLALTRNRGRVVIGAREADVSDDAAGLGIAQCVYWTPTARRSRAAADVPQDRRWQPWGHATHRGPRAPPVRPRRPRARRRGRATPLQRRPAPPCPAGPSARVPPGPWPGASVSPR